MRKSISVPIVHSEFHNDFMDNYEILSQHYLTKEELDECKIKRLSHARTKRTS